MFDAFMKISTIPGESTDEKHAEWIELQSLNWDLAQKAGSAGVSALGGQTGGRADFGDFQIVKLLDKASPKLALACASGEHIPEVIVELCKAGGDKQKYYEVKLADVVISSYQYGGTKTGNEPVPHEQIGMRYSKVGINYIQMDNKTGKAKGNVQTGWDLSKNQKV